MSLDAIKIQEINRLSLLYPIPSKREDLSDSFFYHLDEDLPNIQEYFVYGN